MICVIPARSGSKSIPKKNLINFKGKPLIAWTIEAALKTKKFTRIIVSTDSKKIAYISKKFGAEIPFIRPKKLSDDNVHATYAILHTIKWLNLNENYFPKSIMMLLPTSPLRSFRDINKAINIFKKKNVDAVIGVSSLEKKINNLRYINKKKKLIFFNKKNLNMQRDKFKTLYAVNGAIFLCKTKMLEKHKTFHLPNAHAFIMNNFSSIDINYKEDLIVAKKYYDLISEKTN